MQAQGRINTAAISSNAHSEAGMCWGSLGAVEGEERGSGGGQWLVREAGSALLRTRDLPTTVC